LWDEENDPDWAGAFAQPYWQDVLFNDYFTPIADMDGQTMLDAITRGATSNPVLKAARGLVAAMPNTSYRSGYPLTLAALLQLWTDAVNAGTPAEVDAAMAALAELLGGFNESFVSGVCNPYAHIDDAYSNAVTLDAV